MVQRLLAGGMIAGALAALLAVLFAQQFGEPHVDRALAFEAAHKAAHAMAAEHQLVSRGTQRGLGLLTALLMYGTAIGGLFALCFAFCYGRIGRMSPRGLAFALALGGFVSLSLVPGLVYPATPPAVGQHETVGFRTVCYFALLALSLGALVFAANFGLALSRRIAAFDAALAAAGAYALTMFLAAAILPEIDEVPPQFPADVLWDFRVAAIAMHALVWAALGYLFGLWADRLLRGRGAADAPAMLEPGRPQGSQRR
jgi:hypothetical protein